MIHGMKTIVIGTEAEGLSLTPDDDESLGAPQFLVADLRSEGLTATRGVVNNYATGFEDLAEFFEGIADDWRGWTGERDWRSVEGDLTIMARHEYGHVQLRVGVRDARPGWGNHGWTASADLTIEPGEQLTRIAMDVRALAIGRA